MTLIEMCDRLELRKSVSEKVPSVSKLSALALPAAEAFENLRSRAPILVFLEVYFSRRVAPFGLL